MNMSDVIRLSDCAPTRPINGVKVHHDGDGSIRNNGDTFGSQPTHWGGEIPKIFRVNLQNKTIKIDFPRAIFLLEYGG